MPVYRLHLNSFLTFCQKTTVLLANKFTGGIYIRCHFESKREFFQQSYDANVGGRVQ